MKWIASITIAFLVGAACTTPPVEPPRALPNCTGAPAAGNTVIAQFAAPFAGNPLLTNFFDHDLPSVSGNNYQLTYCGGTEAGRIDGHAGYDWVMHSGTPILAVADGEVIYAQVDAPFFCAVLGTTVSDELSVEVRHPIVGGERFVSSYVHLSRIDVTVGQMVSKGDTLGLSGSTGCSTEPHLHFQVWRLTNTNNGAPAVVDPYGWQGPGTDPWSQQAAGSASAWLWLPGQAPSLVPR